MRLILDVIVKPGSKRPGLSQEDGVVVVRVRERAVEGAANAGCRRALAHAYGVPQSAVELIAGPRSRRKRFAVEIPKGSKR
jgi:uncharacterized protein YggU (UPF0235/DUF167 family)